MDKTFRSVRAFSRVFRRPITSYRNTSSAPVPDEETNLELLTSYNQDIKAGGVVPVFRRALLFPNRVAVQDEVGIYTYSGLYQAAADVSKEIASQLLGETGQAISYMCSNDSTHIIVQWAIWMTGNIAVPLTPLHPPEMLKYFIGDSQSALVVCSQEYEDILTPIANELSRYLLVTTKVKQIKAQLYMSNEVSNKCEDVGRSNAWYGDNEALIIYTSGTTSKPKGVIWTHSMLSTQIAALHTAWQYSAGDVVLHTLPLHHIHGQLNSVNASLAAGARIRMLSSFASHTVWARLLGMGERDETKVTVFHGVPAMYARLAADHGRMFPDAKTAQYVRHTLARMRLMCAGSASLPTSLFNKWEEITGIRLLERYGMSEVGMALSNPYRPVEQRTVGCVGLPLPGVAARIATRDPKSGKLEPLVTVETPLTDMQISLNRLGIASKDYFAETKWEEPKITRHKEPTDGAYQGELLLRGPAVFSRYWNRAPKLDDSDFIDEWFRTGDTVSFEDNRFRILGRTSVDIIKTSGYKVSALQVESAMLEHPNIADAAVLGVPNEHSGEIIASIVVLKDKQIKLTLKDLRDDLGKRLAPYQLPKTLLIVDEMPRNAMGKLDKKEIKKLYGKELVLEK
ncbi:malonate--CoA ligase ACSF3, mitochondrial [Pectinophora gossypiella]|uniref:malonate--CoA ligase ACSF3, mitochondrial n=1 Tax=Pectinophora gossypiella TaxID=13191 RepID=UPI00214E8377|nr:malonate--CoA ligase ACSF3, mitochondrial [Pectinophora gossypiella]